MEMIVLDSETTGLSPRYNKVLTVGMLRIDVEKDFLKIMNKKNILVKHEDYAVNPKALEVNKINLAEHHKIALEPSKACSQINSFILKNHLEESPLLGHNIIFDIRFLNELFRQGNSIPVFSHDFIDTMHIWSALKRKNLISFNLRNSLQTLAGYFEVDYSRAHSALGDCYVTASVYKKMLNLIKK
jgi:DNA polymerase III subunit epsilon